MSSNGLGFVDLGPRGVDRLDYADIAHNQSSNDGDASSLLSDSSHLPSAGVSSATAAPVDNSNASFYQIGYYAHFFDVDTNQILSRLLRSSLPFTSRKFYATPPSTDDGIMTDEDIATRLDSIPDLYGPFWIATTLIFLLAAAGNFANYIQFILAASESSYAASQSSNSNSNSTDSAPTNNVGVTNLLVWSSNFTKVSVAATVFYSWISIVPICVWFAFSRVGVENGAPKKSVAEIASLFGYGLVTMLPVCLICITPISLVRWIAIAVSAAVSSIFLVRNLGADTKSKKVIPVLAVVVGLNLVMAMATKVYFFDW